MTDLFLLALMSLGTYRAWRFLALDTFPPTKWFRDNIARMTDEGYLRPVFHETLSCAWCSGMWLSAATVAWVDYLHDLALPLLWWLAVSFIVGLIAQLDGD